MDQNVVLIAAKSSGPRPELLTPIENDARIVVGNSLEAFGDSLAEATVLFNWSASKELLRQIVLAAPKLRWVHSRNAGLDNMLFPELVESPIPLTNGSGVFSPSLGEFALLAMLYFAKDVPRLRRQQIAGLWKPFDMHPIERKTVGIVGYGDIGREVGLRAKAMGMRVLALKRHLPQAGSDPGPVDAFYATSQLVEMAGLCDYLVVAAPLTAETHHLVGEQVFAAMKSEAVVVNVGRGPVIDEAALVRALSEGRIKGAGLDVFEHEPLPGDSPLYKLENVLLSPHCADNHAEWLEDAARFFISQYERFRKGESLRNVVDKKLGY
ncbi:D-3-phosphoglycerate dehydrogenase [Acidisarcina polymorpha]|uniref:D-3-phosphoglycerate dehydrogenase n=1 Tax=Acidisarcina polymorpha TaxID=2211140 RepID=A0A2Z5FXM5_9BACT|nr:D-2-hydroxyacid dehydrogenase [Acidisarcina polymorpha]AXC11542.1 D-3-phosphoglycerate dehydrogenase [Acidisarcina polymorpha]